LRGGNFPRQAEAGLEEPHYKSGEERSRKEKGLEDFSQEGNKKKTLKQKVEKNW